LRKERKGRKNWNVWRGNSLKGCQIKKLSPAELQGLYLKWKNDPEKMLEQLESWVNEMLKKKSTDSLKDWVDTTLEQKDTWHFLKNIRI
jgi:hypothetical protein